MYIHVQVIVHYTAHQDIYAGLNFGRIAKECKSLVDRNFRQEETSDKTEVQISTRLRRDKITP